MKKRGTKSIKAIMLVSITLLMMFGMVTNCLAASKVFNFNGTNLYSESSKKRAAKILSLKRKKNGSFTHYYSGHKIVIAGNTGSKYTRYPRKILYLKNSGNKKLRFLGIKIGDSRKTVIKKAKKAGYGYYYDAKRTNGRCVGPYYSGFECKYKNNRLVSWVYRYQYTS